MLCTPVIRFLANSLQWDHETGRVEEFHQFFVADLVAIQSKRRCKTTRPLDLDIRMKQFPTERAYLSVSWIDSQERLLRYSCHEAHSIPKTRRDSGNIFQKLTVKYFSVPQQHPAPNATQRCEFFTWRSFSLKFHHLRNHGIQVLLIIFIVLF